MKILYVLSGLIAFSAAIGVNTSENAIRHKTAEGNTTWSLIVDADLTHPGIDHSPLPPVQRQPVYKGVPSYNNAIRHKTADGYTTWSLIVDSDIPSDGIVDSDIPSDGIKEIDLQKLNNFENKNSKK